MFTSPSPFNIFSPLVYQGWCSGAQPQATGHEASILILCFLETTYFVILDNTGIMQLGSQYPVLVGSRDGYRSKRSSSVRGRDELQIDNTVVNVKYVWGFSTATRCHCIQSQILTRL